MWWTMDPVGMYLTVLIIGIVLTVVVGQILIRSGRPVVDDVFQRPETATSVTRLLGVLFHLIVLGMIALIAAIDVTVGRPAQTIVVRVGFMLLVLGAAYGGTLMLLTRLRSHRQLQLALDEQAQAVQQYGGQQGISAPAVYPNSVTPQPTSPVSDSGPPR